MLVFCSNYWDHCIGMNINDYLSYVILWQKLSNFVERVCKDRDDSHGYLHMSTVAQNAVKIFQMEHKSVDQNNIKKLLEYITIVGWLHDVADHKYDLDGFLKMQVFEFVTSLMKFDEAELIMKIIDHISYSKENKAIIAGNPINFREVLGEMGALVRDFVSDADKLEALGRIGFERCVEFTSHEYKKKYGVDIPYDLLKQEVNKHAQEKLLRLKDEFIKTNYGRELATQLHNELIMELEHMQ